MENTVQSWVFIVGNLSLFGALVWFGINLATSANRAEWQGGFAGSFLWLGIFLLEMVTIGMLANAGG